MERGVEMFDFDVIAYGVLGISLSLSAIQIGHWLLNANPRAVVNAGRWSIVGLIGLAPMLILWLAMSGRTTLALLLAAFILPVVVRGGLRWRALFSLPNLARENCPRWDQHFAAPIVPDHAVRPRPMNPDLAEQCIAVLRAYLHEADGIKPDRMRLADGLPNSIVNGVRRRRMSAEEALDVLGLDATAGPRQVNEAHHRLQQKLKPELGETHYLTAKIDEAKDVLLEQ
jgi:hypothetical protein